MGDINKDDLYNMFKSYENNVKYNIQLYDRQEILVKEQTSMINSLGTLSEKILNLNKLLENLIKSLSDHHTTGHEERVSLQGKSKEIHDGIVGVSNQIIDLKIGSIKDHGTLRTGLIIISVGLSSVIIALIVALEKIWAKSDIIDAVAKFIGIQN